MSVYAMTKIENKRLGSQSKYKIYIRALGAIMLFVNVCNFEIHHTSSESAYKAKIIKYSFYHFPTCAPPYGTYLNCKISLCTLIELQA